MERAWPDSDRTSRNWGRCRPQPDRDRQKRGRLRPMSTKCSWVWQIILQMSTTVGSTFTRRVPNSTKFEPTSPNQSAPDNSSLAARAFGSHRPLASNAHTGNLWPRLGTRKKQVWPTPCHILRRYTAAPHRARWEREVKASYSMPLCGRHRGSEDDGPPSTL